MEKVGIIGLGLIGGSIFKDLKTLGYDVAAVSQSQQGEGIYKNYDTLKDRDIVFVCTPMSKTIEVLDELENILPETAIVTDVGSLKEFVCKKPRPYRFIPSHPMAGTENKGFESAVEGLFRGKKWVIIESGEETGQPGSRAAKSLGLICNLSNPSTPSTPQPLISIITALGAVPVYMGAKEHDEAAALISHMPMVVAQALFLAAQDNPLALEIAASGFRDMTRLALSNQEMAMDMVKMNSENIQAAILKLYNAIGELMTNNYPELIAKIKQERSNLFTNV
jgi:prephenate dehydrogenase